MFWFSDVFIPLYRSLTWSIYFVSCPPTSVCIYDWFDGCSCQLVVIGIDTFVLASLIA